MLFGGSETHQILKEILSKVNVVIDSSIFPRENQLFKAIFFLFGAFHIDSEIQSFI